MAKQLNVNMSFQADTSQAKKVLSDLNKMLDNILSHRSITIEDQSIQQAKQAALDLKHHLDAAVNVNTGKLDLSKFSASLNKSGQSLQGLYTNLSKIGPEGQSAFLSLSQSIAKADASAITLGSKLGNLMTVLKNTARWQISSSILHGFMGSIQGAYRYAQDLNESLNNIRIVTGQNEEQMARFAKTANDAAKALSTTTTQYTNASLIYYQQGLSDEEVKARTDATIKLANVSRQSAEEVSDQMTAVWNNFAEGSDNLEYYIDVMAKLGATTASSTQEISAGLEKFAAVANTVGLSYEYATAALATVTAKTRQSADVVGTAFKTLFARLQDLELGDTLEDGTTLGKYSAALNAVGVNIKDINGEVKDMDQILDELGSKWNNIAKDQQIALAQTVAGTRQYTQLVALMDNWDFMQENLNTVAGASGELDRQAKIYAESWEAARDRVTAAAEEIYSQLLNDNAFIDILNGFEKFLNLISNIIDGLGGLKGVLLLIGSIFMQQYAKEMPVFLSKMISQIQILTGAAEKQRQAMLNNNNEILMSMNGGDSKGLSAQIIGMQKVSEMYSELAAKRKTLSSAEIAAYEQKIKDVEMYSQMAEAIGREVDKLNEEASALEREASKDLQNAGNLNGNNLNLNNLSNESLSLINPEFEKINIEIEKAKKGIKETKDEADSPIGQAWRDYLKELQNDAEQLKQKLSGKDLLQGFEEASRRVGKVQNVLDTISRKTSQWSKEIKNIGTDSKAVENLQKEIIAYRDKLEEAGVETKELDEAIKAFKNDGTGLQEAVDIISTIGDNDPALKIATVEAAVEQYKSTLIELGVNSVVLDDLDAKWRKGEKTLEEYTTALKELEAQQKGTLQHQLKASEVFTNLGSTLMQVSMSINAVKNIGNIWDDKDLSAGEKVLQTMTALGTLIPTIVSLKKMLTKENLKEASSAVIAAAAQAGSNVAKAMGIPIDYAKGASGWAALGPALFFVAIAAAVIAALYGVYKLIESLVNAETEEEAALRKANEAMEEAKQAAEDTKAAYENLKNAVSDYDDAVDALEKCTKGTQEWRDAFQEVLDKTMDLIQTYPQLLKYNNLFKSDGTLNQDVLHEAVNEAAAIANAASISVIKAQRNVQIAQENLKRSNLNQSVKSSVGYGSYYTPSHNSQDMRSSTQGGQQNQSQIISAQTLTDQVLNALQSSNVNYADPKAIEQFVREQIAGKVAESDLDRAVENITNAITPLSDQFGQLANESKGTALALNNASKLIANSFFGEELANDPTKELAYTMAYNQWIDDREDYYSTGIKYLENHHAGKNDNRDRMLKGSADGKGESGAQLVEMMDTYLLASGKGNEGWKTSDSNMIEHEDDEEYVIFKDSEGKEHRVRSDVLLNTVVEYDAQNKKNDIIQKGNEIYKSQNYNAAQLSYLTDMNYNGSKMGDVQALSNSGQSLEDLIGDNDAIKDFLAKKWGMDVNDITDAMLDTFKSGYQEEMQTALAELDKVPKYIQDRMGENLISNLKVEDVTKVGDMYTKVLANGGEQGIALLNSIVSKAGNEADEVMSALSSMDLASMSVEDVNTALANLGIEFQFTGNEIYNLGKILSKAGAVTAESAQETYKSISSIASGLKQLGDTIDKEAYNKLMELNPALSSYFTMMADGTYMLTGAAKDFQTAVQTSQLDQLRQAQITASETAMAYTSLQGKGIFNQIAEDQVINQILSEAATKGNRSNLGFRTKEEATKYLVGQGAISEKNLWENYGSTTDAQLKILEDNGMDTTKWRAQIEAGENLIDVIFDVDEAYNGLELSEEDYAKKASEAAEEVIKLNEAMKEASYQAEIANANLDYETTEQYANVLMELYEAEGMTKDQARELAIANQRLDRGLNSLNDNFEEWTESLKNTGKNTAEYAQTISGVREAFSDLLNIADADELSLGWIEQWMNDGEKMKKIMDGDQEAIQELRESAFTEMTTNVFTDMKNSVQEMIDSLNEAGKEVPERLQAINDALASGKFEAENLRAAIQDLSENEIGAGAVLSQEYVDSLNQMLAAGVLTEQQLNDIFSQIGYKPKVTTATVDQDTFIPEYTTEEYLMDGDTKTFNAGTEQEITVTGVRKVSKTWQSGGETMTQKVPVAQIESADKAGGNIDIVNAGAQRITPSHGATSSGKSGGKGGGGGGGKSPTKKAIEKKDDESERYHVVRAQIEDLTKEYDAASKAKDRLFGAARLQMLDKEIAATDKLAKKQKQYLDEIEQYRKSDFSALTSTGKKNGIQYTVEDANGNQKLKTANVLGLKDWLGMDVIADPNGVITNYDQIMEAAKNWYNKKIDEYNAMSASQQEAADKNGWKDLVEGQYSGFMDLLKQYEETNDLWEEEFQKLLDKYREKQDLELEKFQYKIEINVKLNDAEIKRLEYIRKSLADDRWKSVEYLMTLWNNEDKNSTYQQLLEQGGIHAAAAEELLGASHGDIQLDANGNVISQPQYSDAGWLEALDQEEEAIYNNIDALYDLDDQMVHYYEETLSNANEKLNQYMTKLEDCTALLEHYKTLMGLIDKQDSEYYARMDKLLKAQQQTAANEYARAEQEYELAEKRYREMLAEYENTDWTGNEAGQQKMEEQLQAAYEHMTEWQDKALSKAEALAEAIKAVYENAVEGASHEMEMALTGGMGFDELSNSMDRASSTADLLLTKTNQIYETNKLMRQLSQDIDKIDSAAAKTKLKNFRDEIQDMQNMNEMTKFDLEVAKARYEVLKAQIALEEAQNAKSTVRLQRDNEGNYGYVYTADQDKINDARQQLEDKQNDLYNLTLEKANESAQALIQLDQDYVAELNRINTEYANDEQRRQELLAQLEEEYLRKREILEKDAATANYWLNETAATDTSEAWGNAYKGIIADTDTWKTESEKYIGAVNTAHQQYQQDIDKTVKPAVDRLDEAIGKATQDSEKYSKWFEDFAKDNNSNLKAISDITNEYFKQRQEIIALIKQLNNYIAQIDAARRALAQLQAQEQQPKDRSSSSQAGTGATLSSSSGSSGSSSSGSGSSGSSSNGSSSNSNSGSSNSSSGNKTIDNIRYYKCGNPEKHKKIITYKDKTTKEELEKHEWILGGAGYVCQKCSAMKTINGAYVSIKTGGYTGEWVGGSQESNGKLAMLHQKELVLNEDDTKNMLKTVSLVREISQILDLQAGVASLSTGISPASIWDNTQTLEQMVTIHAEFPNAVNHTEIEEAFDTLVNRASQYAGRPRK